MPEAMFLINPENQAFVEGKADRPRETTPKALNYMLFTSVLIAVFALLLGGIPLLAELDPLFNWEKTDAKIERIEKTGENRYAMDYTLLDNGHRGGVEFSPGTLDNTDWDELEAGDTVELRYNPDDPDEIRLPGEILGDVADNLIYLGLCFPLPLIFAGYLTFILTREHKQARLLADKGQVVEGQLTSFEVLAETDTRYRVTLDYEFTSPETDKTLAGNVAPTNRPELKDAPRPEPGTPVAVLYLDDEHYRLL
jgi:hypothetical protein